MVGGHLTKVRKKKERVPIAIVPSKVVPKQQLAALKQSLKQVTASISSLQKFAGSLSIKKPDPRDRQYQKYIDTHCDRLKQDVAKIPIGTLPLVGYRFGNYVAWLEKTIEEARKLGKLGEVGKFWTSMDIVKKQLDAIGRVLTLQNDFLNKGIPQNVKVGDADQPVEWLLESLARVIRTVGTPNEELYRSAVKAMELYIANAELYNTDDLNTRRERDALIKFIIDKGEKVLELRRTRKAYSKKEIARDQRRLRSFERNIKVMKVQLRAYNISVFRRWIAAIDLKLKDRTMELQLKDSMTALRLEINGMLAKTRKGLPLDQKETSELSNRYYRLVEGKEAPMTTTEWLDSLRKRAAGLRGKGRVVGTGTPQWWGKHALELLRVDRPNLAALAIAMGTLEASASKVTRKGAKEYVSSYWRIRNAVKSGLAITPGMRVVYARQVELGSIIVEADLMAKRFARRGSAARRKLLLSVLTLVRRRMDKGDFAGAMRIMDMAKAYGSLMLQYGRRSWTGAKQMDDALRAERDKGKDASELFSRGIASHVFSLEVRKCSKAIRYWSRRGMRTQFQVTESVLKKTEQFAAAGKLKDARRLLTLVVMYIDAAGRLGTTGTASLKGMESALAAIMAGKTSVAGAGIEKTFLESYHLTQNTYFGNSLKQVEQMRKWWPIGGSVIKAAMATISERAKNGDYRGAYILLNYVQEFYGKTGKGKKLGWRYKLAAREYIREKIKGYNAGVWGMLEAIKKEMKAKTPGEQAVAAQFFDKGTAKIADTHELQKILAKLKAKHKTVPLIITRYEHNNPDDPVLKGGKTLAQLMTIMTGAANSGDVRTYNSRIQVFNKRFTIVAARAKRRATIDAWLKGLARMGKAVDGLLKIYAGGTRGESVATARLGGLKDRMTKLTATLKTLTKVRDPLVAREFLEFVQLGKLIKKEGRRARAYTLIINQIKLNGNYMKMVSAGSGNLAAIAKSAIKRADRELHNALRSALSGSRQDTESAYGAAMGWRRQAMVAFCAENAGKVSAVRAWISFFRGAVGQRGARIRASYAPYIRLQMAAFRQLVSKTPTKEDLVLGENMLQMARATEVSVFAIPSTNLSQQFSSSLASNQKAVLALASKTLAAFNAGSLTLASMKRNLKSALSRWKALEYRARRNAKIGNVIATVAALALTLFPPTSLLGGAIFTTMAWDRVATEYSMRGKASGESWFWLGFTVATLGFAGSASMFRGWANSAKALGATNASKLLVTARVLEYTTLAIGIGFAGYAIPQAYKAWKKGEYFDAVFLAGMALFPFALMGGAYAWRAIAARRAGRSLPTEVREVLENTMPEQAAVDIAITGSRRARRGDAVRTSEGLLAFLGKYVKKGTRGRQRMLEKLPENMRETVSQLATRKDVLEAIKAFRKGKEIPKTAEEVLNRAVKSFEEGPKPEPTGPRGARTEWEASTWLGDQGLGAFRDFIADLLVPEGAPAARLNARAGARTRLEALRTDNPKAAKAIDRLLTSLRENDIARNSLQRNRWDNPNLNKLINEARTELGNVIPKKVQSAENQAVGTYHQELVMVAGGEPIVITRPGRPVIAPAPRTVASAGGGKPPALTPGQVSAGAMGGAAGRRAAPGEPIKVGGETQVVVEVQQPPQRGWAARKVDWIKKKWSEHKEANEAAKQKPQDPEALVDQTTAALDELISTVTSAENHGLLISTLKGDASIAAAERSLLATRIRSAPDRLTAIVKTIYRRIHDKSTPSDAKGPLWKLLSKIFAHDDVRNAFIRIGQKDTELAKITNAVDRVTRGAAQQNKDTNGNPQPVPVELFRKRLAEQSFKGDMTLLIQTLEYGTAVRTEPYVAKYAELQNITIPRLKARIAKIEKPSKLSRLKTKAGREARLKILKQKLQQAEDYLADINKELARPENAPLSNTEYLLGAELSPPHRASALKSLHENNIITGLSIVTELQNATSAARNRLQAIDTANKPIAQELKGQVERSISNEPTAALDSILLNALRSEKVVNAATKGLTKDLYLQAVKEGNLTEVLAKLQKAFRDSPLMKEINDFVTSARRELSGPFTIMNQLTEIGNNAVASGEAFIGVAGAEITPVLSRVSAWWRRSWLTSRLLRWPTFRWVKAGGEASSGMIPTFFSILSRVTTNQWIRARAAGASARYPTLFTYFARRGIRMFKTPPVTGWKGVKAVSWIALQTIFNAAAGISAYWLIRRMLTGRPKEVVDMCWRDHGVKCTIEEIREIQNHPEFFTALSTKVLAGSHRRPGSVESLKEMLKSRQWYLNIPRLAEIIRIGKAMRLKLTKINILIALYKTGKTQETKDKAKADLAPLLKTWGITMDALDKILADKTKYGLAQQLNAADMLELAREHFRGKGLMATPKDIIIEQFLTDAGVPFQRGEGAADFLTKNPEMFYTLWTAVQKGYLPRVNIKDAVSALADANLLAKVRADAKISGNTFEVQLALELTNKKIYIKDVIPPGSFLDRLDHRAARRKDAALIKMLKKQIADPAVMAKLNKLIIRKDEQIYGDPDALAKWIVNYSGKNLVGDAKKQGYVGPDALNAISKSPAALQKRIVQLVNAKSKGTQGILPWMKANIDEIKDLGEILKYVAGMPWADNPGDYYDSATKKGQLVRMETLFRKNGWMRKLTKFGRRGKPIKKAPLSPKARAALFESLSQEGRIRMIKGLPDKERSRMIKVFTPKQRQLYEKLPKNVRVAIGLKRTGAPSAKTAVPSKIEKPVTHKDAVARGLVQPGGTIDKFYKSEQGKPVEKALRGMMEQIWGKEKGRKRRKAKADRNRDYLLLVYHRAMGGKGPITDELRKKYTHPSRVPQVKSVILAYLKSDTYKTLSGEQSKKGGVPLLKRAGFTGKMVNNQLEVTITGMPDFKSLRSFIMSYIITPLVER